MPKKEKNINRKFLNYLFILISIAAVVGISLSSPKETYAVNWITSCTISHSAPNDPIVFPGLPGASHLHDFMGARTTDAFSTANSLFAGATNCLTTGDHSSYWVPALYKNGNVRVLPGGTSKHILAYYINSGGPVQPYPFGLKMVIGNARATSEAQNTYIGQGRIQFKCGPGSGTETNSPPASCSSGIMVPIFTFPNCWDGRNLDSADHISHMAYGGGSCPPSHPVKVPTLKAFIRYGVGTAPMLPINLASGPYYTAHMDFFNAWDPAALKELIDRCLNSGGGNCGQNPPVTGGGTTTPTPSPTPGGGTPGDTDNDGDVDIFDFMRMSNNFGQNVSGGPSDGDFNRDGVVTILDFQILSANWTG